MKLLRCTAKNFGSYKDIELDFSQLGLALVYGPTGAGKSTLADLACWTLFGVTAKDGNVDDVRSWTTPDEPTTATQEVELSDGTTIRVTRIRGKQGENDLSYTDAANPDKLVRGKDLADTQKLLEAILAVNSDEYITAAYFHEFSETGRFFTSAAKARRTLFERLAVLETPKRLSSGSGLRRKSLKSEIAHLQSTVDRLTGKLDESQKALSDTKTRKESWGGRQARLCNDLASKRENFQRDRSENVKRLDLRSYEFEKTKAKAVQEQEDEKKELQSSYQGYEVNWKLKIKEVKDFIAELEKSVCEACGGPNDNEAVAHWRDELDNLRQHSDKGELQRRRILECEKEIQRLEATINPVLEKIEAEKAKENKYQEQLEIEQARENPYTAQLAQLEADQFQLASELVNAEELLATASYEFDALVQISDLSDDLRGLLLKNAVEGIQDATNKRLEAYFDSEIKVGFTLEGSDSLNVSIQKNGYDCNYKQLSKGQRQLLKLCFVLAVMEAAANKTGVHFDNLWFDEALDGLDGSLKLKAFSMFEELAKSHVSIMLIDHDTGFQQCFHRRYKVSLIDDSSIIEEES